MHRKFGRRFSIHNPEVTPQLRKLPRKIYKGCLTVGIRNECRAYLMNRIMSKAKKSSLNKTIEDAGILFAKNAKGGLLVTKMQWLPLAVILQKHQRHYLVDAGKLVKWIDNKFEYELQTSDTLGFFHFHPKSSDLSNQLTVADFEAMNVEKAISSLFNLEHIHILMMQSGAGVTFKSYALSCQQSTIRLTELPTTLLDS